MKIGVFDSGVGGRSVAQAIQKAFPDQTIVFRSDSANVPYGTKSPDELLALAVPILEKMAADDCTVIVIACNTLTTTVITQLRQRISVPLVAVEPMVKPAAEQTKSKVIAVCATPTTLASARYQELKRSYASEVGILEPDCSDWSAMIENNTVDHENIENRIQAVLDEQADVIVLGCTHYHWIEAEIKELARGRATVLQPEKALVEQLTQVLSRQ